MNKTLIERARIICVYSGLPKQFWAEAINTSAYLINQGLSVSLEHKIPEEVKLSHLRFFNYAAYLYISDQGKNKLDIDLKKFTFIDYGEGEFGYRLCDDENKNMIYNRDMTFNEIVIYKDTHNTTTKD